MQNQLSNVDTVKKTIYLQLSDIHKITGINSLILSMCLVDTLAGFYSGYIGQKKGNRTRFLIFVEKYLPQYKDFLYDVRCNLTHSFSNTVSNFMFIDDNVFTRSFSEIQNILGSPIFNIDLFKQDLSKAINVYFEELSNPINREVINNFNLRYNSLAILTDSNLGTVRNLNGQIVNKIENLDSLPSVDLKIAIASPIKIKK